jgi:DNA-binding beta-propeller fold protein YncE
VGGRGLTLLATGSLVVGALTGCGRSGFAPAAEPAVSPALTRTPAGTTFVVGSEPEGLVVAPGGRRAAVVTRDPSRLTIVDLARRSVIGRVPLPATARHLSSGPGGEAVLVPVEQSDQLVKVDLRSGDERAIDVGDHPHDATTADGRVFVGNEFGDTISVVNGDRVTETLPAPAQPGGVAAAGGAVAVVAVAERVLGVYDARTLASLGTAPAGDGPTHVVASGDRAWVADTDGDAILTFRLRPAPRLIATTPVSGAPYGIALDPRRRRLWVTLTERNEVVVFDVSDGGARELARYPTVRQPNSVAVDERDGTAVIAGRADGRLELIGVRR